MDNVWTNLGNRLETAWKKPTKPNSKRPKDGEIIDEEKSVRWNREGTVPSLRSMYGLRSPCSSSTSCCPMRLSGSAGSASCVSAANISSRRTVPH